MLDAVVPEINATIAAESSSADIIVQMPIQTKDFDTSSNPNNSQLNLDDLDARNVNLLGFLNDDPNDSIVDMIDGVTGHFYYQEGQQQNSDPNGAWKHSYDNIDTIIAQVASMADDWAGKDLYITEWGVHFKPVEGATSEQENWGLQQLAPTLEIFSKMLEYGVDSADAWPLLYHTTAMAEGKSLRPMGHLFDVMNDLIPGKTSSTSKRALRHSTCMLL